MLTGKRQIITAINIILTGIVVTIHAASTERSVPTYPVFKEFRQLNAEQLAQARAARDAADKMLQECRDKYRRTPSMYPGMKPPEIAKIPKTQEEIEEYKKIITAFQEVIDKYEGTEIAAYCFKRIVVPYKAIGQNQDAIKQLEKASEKFAGTVFEYEAFITIAGIYRESLNDTDNAFKWLEKVPKPNNESPDGTVSVEYYTEADQNYILAQSRIAQYEIEIGKTFNAIERYNALSKRYPSQKNSFDFELERFLKVNSPENSSIPRVSSVETSPSATVTPYPVPRGLNSNKTRPPEGITAWYPGETIELLKDFSEEEKKEYEKNLSLLKLRWNLLSERRQEVDEAIVKLASMGEKVIEPIMYDFNNPKQTFSFRHESVNVLEKLKSDKARDALLKIALGETIEVQASLKQWASSKFISSVDNKSDAKKLLASQDLGVLNNALLALKGQSIDQDLLTRLAGILGTEIKGLSELTLCWNIASIFAEDPNPVNAGQKVSLTISAIEKVPQIPIAEQFFSHSATNYGESTYSSCINALSKIKDANSILKEYTARTSGRTRYCIVIARANRGDASVKNDLIKILGDKDAEMFRAWAARSFETIGTPDDVPFLKAIAGSDTLERDPRDSMRSAPIFPVRMAADNAIKKIQANAKDK